jgi:hypothetical protein
MTFNFCECAPVVYYRNIASVVASCNTNNFFFGAEIFNPQKLNVIFLDQNRRNYRLYGM